MDPTVTTESTAGNRLRSIAGLTAACLACCVPMLVVVGAVSLGAVVAGTVGLGLIVAIIGVAAVASRHRH